MANLITRYTNGTFEGDISTWQAEFDPNGTSAQARDLVVFHEGAASVKLTTKASPEPGQFFTPHTLGLLLVRFPATFGQAVEVKVRIKCSAEMPDDVVFYISPYADLTQDLKGFIIPMRASLAKDGFVELRANFYPNIFSGEAAFHIYALFNSTSFREQAESFPEGSDDLYSLLFGYTAQTPIPAGALVWIDAMTAETKAIPEEEDALNMQFLGRRLYYVQNVFYLQVGATRTVIDEPIKWDAVLISVVWDKKSKAYRFEFSDKDVLLEFDNAAGREILREQYRLLGSNADVKLLFGEYNRLTEELTIHYTGSINFGPGSAEDTETTFKANIERQSLNEKLRVYFDTRVNVFRDTSLGGLALAPLQTKDLFLHPRLLTFRAKYTYNPRVDPEVALISEPIFGGDQQFKSAVPPFTYTNRTPGANNQVSNNIDGLVEPTPPDGQLVYAGLELSPGVSRRTFRFDNVRVLFSFTMGNTSAELFAGVAIYKKSQIATGPNDGDLFVPLDSLHISHYASFGNVAGDKQFVAFLSGTIDLLADEAIFIKAFFYQSNTSAFDITNFKFIQTDTFTMEVNEQTVYSPTLISAPRIHDVVNRQLEIILDTVNPLKSDFLGRIDLGYAANGCASDHFAMDGKIIRQFADRAFSLSAKDHYNSLDGLFNMGMSVERDANEVESVRLEEMPYFFRDALLIDIKVIAGYVKRPASDYLFSEINCKFKKYPRDNQQDSIEDFHTMMNYITPLKRIKNKLQIDIEAILSGYYIEYTRQQAFNTNPTNAYETDEDLFLISAKAGDAVHVGADITFDQAAGTIRIDKIIPIVTGDYLNIANATGGVTNGLYEVTRVDVSFFFDHMVLTVAEALATDGAGTGDATISDELGAAVERYQAKRDEDFEAASGGIPGVITGVPFPKSVYNLEHHIKRIVLRWAKMFQAGWDFLFVDPALGDGITFNEGANNTGVITELKEAVACKYGSTEELTAADAFFQSITSMDRPIFGKDEVEFKAPLTWDAFNYIRKAYEGRNPDGKDYGYLQWRNPDGIIERGYNLGMKFNPNTQICTFNLILKYDGD